MIEVVSKKTPKELLKTVTCERCGWTYSYLPKSDAIESNCIDLRGCSELWYYIPCINEACHDPYRHNGKTQIEVPYPR